MSTSGKSECICWHIFGDTRPGANVCTVTNGNRGNQLCAASDKYFRFNRCLVFINTVVIAGNRARTDVAITANDSIANIAQMIDLGPFADLGFLGWTRRGFNPSLPPRQPRVFRRAAPFYRSRRPPGPKKPDFSVFWADFFRSRKSSKKRILPKRPKISKIRPPSVFGIDFARVLVPFWLSLGSFLVLFGGPKPIQNRY